jgi:hypothetical protein
MEYLNSFKTSIDFQSKDEAKEFIIKQVRFHVCALGGTGR